jgi:hypothetical protein
VGLIEAASDIPLFFPGKSCLQDVVEDKGVRYCICGRPHYGSFMLGCDKCERWYRGHCVQVDKEQGGALEDWLVVRASALQSAVSILLVFRTWKRSVKQSQRFAVSVRLHVGSSVFTARNGMRQD